MEKKKRLPLKGKKSHYSKVADNLEKIQQRNEYLEKKEINKGFLDLF